MIDARIVDTLQGIAIALFLATVLGLAWRFRAAPRAVEDLERRVWERATAQGERLQSEIDALRREIRDIRQENDELRAWVVDLTQQVVGLGGRPVPRPRLYPPATTPAVDDIYEALRTAYSLEDLEVVAQDAGIAGGSIHGQTIPSYALHLYQAAERCGRMEQLGQVVRASRPHLFGGQS